MENDSLFITNTNNDCLNFHSEPFNSSSSSSCYFHLNSNLNISPDFIAGGGRDDGPAANVSSSYAAPKNFPPPKLNLPAAPMAPFAGDPDFAERAARFSNFGLPLHGQFQPQQPAVSDPLSSPGSGGGGNSRKRKAPPAKTKTPLSCPVNPSSSKRDEENDAKRSKTAEQTERETKTEQKQGKDSNAKLPEPPKDYIHVRARRGQATDSHSLAERVRREKISERMKFLQDLVPGCNKVTGKAVMLDEIINYVQSLQRQVEFLSMKLASVNTRLDFDIENVLQKDVQSHPQQGSMPNSVYPMEAAACSFSLQPSHSCNILQNIVTSGIDSIYTPITLETNLERNSGLQFPPISSCFTDSATSQVGSFWEDELHSVVQMGFVPSQEPTYSSQGFQGSVSASPTKIELQ